MSKLDYLPMHTCKRCGVKYEPSKAVGSALPLTYCGLFCEIGDLGYSLDALEKAVFIKRERNNTPLSEFIGEPEQVSVV